MSESKDLMKSASTAVVVGAQWGDEGKGKLRRLAGVSAAGARRRNPERSEGTHEGG